MFSIRKCIMIAMVVVPTVGCAHEYGTVVHERVDVYQRPGVVLQRQTVVEREYTNYSRSPSINTQQRAQQQRIARGVRSGELTRGEADRLRDEQRDIAREERRYRADGYLSAAERADLQRDLNRASRHIHNEANDRQDR